MKGKKYNYATNNNKFQQQNNRINFLCFQIKKQFARQKIMKILTKLFFFKLLGKFMKKFKVYDEEKPEKSNFAWLLLQAEVFIDAKFFILWFMEQHDFNGVKCDSTLMISLTAPWLSKLKQFKRLVSLEIKWKLMLEIESEWAAKVILSENLIKKN